MKTRLNILLSHTLPAKNTLEVMLKNENPKQWEFVAVYDDENE